MLQISIFLSRHGSTMLLIGHFSNGGLFIKVFAQSRPLRFARWVARIILLFRRLVRPVSYVLIRTGSSISEHAVRKSEISLDELADAVDMTSTTSAEEHNMLSGIVKFANTEVQEIMRPRMDVVAVAVGESYESVRGRIIESGFSRIPVYEEDLDNIRGILYVKDLLPYINNGDEFDWRQLLRKAYFVPEHKKINDLLEEFQSNKVHMAVVVDEYGSTLGIVSLEDILEEIVGEISDESDTVETFYTKLDERNYLFDGKTHIGDFERVLQLPEETFSDCKGKAETLAGQTVTVEGVCTHTCKHGATKIFLMGSDDTQTIRVEAGELGSFDTKCVNNMVRVTGKLMEQRIDEAYLQQWEARLKNSAVQQHGETAAGCDSEKKARGETADTSEGRIADFRARIAQRQKAEGKAYLSFYYLQAENYEIR